MCSGISRRARIRGRLPAPRASTASGSARSIRNLFQDQAYSSGASFGHSDPAVRRALRHCYDSIAIGRAVGSDTLSLLFADGPNYPGQGERLAIASGASNPPHAVLPVSPSASRARPDDAGRKYKPLNWLTTRPTSRTQQKVLRRAGEEGRPKRAKVLAGSSGHHYAGQNIEQIVAFLLDEGMLGGFHFNDRRYADRRPDAGLPIDPYQVCLGPLHGVIHLPFAADRGRAPEIAYMIDQSHNERAEDRGPPSRRS